VLLLEGGRRGATDRVCGELLASETPAATELLLVTLVDTPSSRLAVWDGTADERPAATVAVAMAGNGVADAGEFDVRTFSDPANLTRLGVRITEALADLDGDRLAVCFHSLSVLLQYAPVEQVFQFLSVLKAHLDAADAAAHFHLDPASHDERTVAALRPLLDEVVDAGEV